MSVDSQLRQRANDQCELTGGTTELTSFAVPPKDGNTPEECVLVQAALINQIKGSEELQANDWHGLRDSIWSPEAAVQVLSYRLLQRLATTESWAQDLLDGAYLDDETRAWAEQGGGTAVVHKDSNGHVLEAGDSVVLIKDLKVKGANFTAKRGTAVRRISLVADNAEHIEGKVEGQRIVILTQYVKKSK